MMESRRRAEFRGLRRIVMLAGDGLGPAADADTGVQPAAYSTQEGSLLLSQECSLLLSQECSLLLRGTDASRKSI